MNVIGLSQGFEDLAETFAVADAMTGDDDHVPGTARVDIDSRRFPGTCHRGMHGSRHAGHLELIGSNGDGLSVTFFDSEQAAEAAEPTFDEEMPKKLGDVFAQWEGRRAAVGRYKVVVDERR